MSLGTRIKEVLGSPDSADAAHGEVDHRTPGSFPVDDVADSGSTSQNKLTSDVPRGHKHTDSGVGLIDASDVPKRRDDAPSLGGGGYPNTIQPISQADQKNQVHEAARAFGSDTSGGINSSKDTDNEIASEPVAKPTSSIGQGFLSNHDSGLDGNSTTMHASSDNDFKRDGTLSGMATGATTSGLASHHVGSPASKEHTDISHSGADRSTTTTTTGVTHWGDLPHGTGIYNTVTGHGSSEDHDPHRGSGIHDTVTRHGSSEDHDTQRVATPTLVTTSGHGLHTGTGTYNTVTGHGSPEDHDSQRTVKSTPAATSTIGTTSNASDDKPSPERHFMLRPEVHDALDNTINKPETKKLNESTSNKDALIGTGTGAGAAGLAGYELSRRHGEHVSREPNEANLATHQGVDSEIDTTRTADGALSRNYDDGQDTKQRQETAPGENNGRHNSKLAGIFHHDHDADQEAKKKEKEAQKEAERGAKKAHHDAQKAAEHDAKHDAKRSDKDAKHAAQKAEKDANREAQRQRDHEAGEIAAAAAAAEAAAAYTAYSEAAHSGAARSRQDAKLQEKSTSEDSTNSKGEKGGKLRALFHRGHKAKDGKNETPEEETSHKLQKKHDQKRDLAAAGAGVYGISQLGQEHHDKTSPHSDTHLTGVPAMNQNETSSAKSDQTARNTALAGAGTGVIGATGYYAHDRDHDRSTIDPSASKLHTTAAVTQDPSTTTGVARYDVPVTSGSENFATSSATTGPTQNDHTSRNTVAGAGAALAGAGAAGAYVHHRDQKREDTATSKPSEPVTTKNNEVDSSLPTAHTSQDPSHGGMYNVLPSGTPSGVSAGVSSSEGKSAASTATGHLVADPTIPTSRSSNDPSHGGLYNVLPSGTPSGINPDYCKAGNN